MTQPTPEFAVTAEDEDNTDKRKLALIGGVACVALAGGGWFLLGGSGSSDDANVGLAPVVHHVVKPAVKPAVPTPAALVPSASNVKLGRDPFHVLYVVPAAAGAGATTTNTTPTNTTPTGTSGTDTPAAAPYSLKLLSVSGARTNGRIYAFTVGATKKSVVAAQKFGKYHELVVLSYVKNAKCAVTGALVQVGDDDPITVRIGEKITVL